MGYTVSMATYYLNSWHKDPSTESAIMDEQSVIIEGRKLAAMGAFPLYTQYVDGVAMRDMVEYNGKLEFAFVA